MRRRAERLRDLWSADARFLPLEEEDGDPSIGDNDDWQVTFVDQVSVNRSSCFMKRRFVFHGRQGCLAFNQKFMSQLSQLVRKFSEN